MVTSSRSFPISKIENLLTVCEVSRGLEEKKFPRYPPLCHLWTSRECEIFLKYCPSKRNGDLLIWPCIHSASSDTESKDRGHQKSITPDKSKQYADSNQW